MTYGKWGAWGKNRAGSWSLWATRFESDWGPLVHIFAYSSGFFPKNVKDYSTYYVKRPFIPGQTFKLSTKASDSKNFKRTKFLRVPQIFSLEISGLKVALVLLCEFSLYRGFSLTSLKDDPALGRKAENHSCTERPDCQWRVLQGRSWSN